MSDASFDYDVIVIGAGYGGFDAAKHAADYALGRVSKDEDVAAATLFLASNCARQITGVDLPVDGGWAAL